MKKALVTGGAGYKGTLLVEELLKAGLEVTLLDNFMYGYEPALFFSNNPNCHILNLDIRNIKESDLKEYDIVYHLAGISGYPACEANPHSAHTINVASTQRIKDALSKQQILVYASTTSMYGKTQSECFETTEPAPTSLYGMTKYEAEKICMEHPNGIAFRFATLFGVSYKMRSDLLLNDFTHRAVTDRTLVLFDSGSVRTFLHVKDAIHAYAMVLDHAEAMAGEVYNVGDNNMNYSKLDCAQKIKEYVPHLDIIQSKLNDLDERNFVINFDKLNKFGFKPTVSMDEGIKEMVKLYKWFHPNKPFNTI